MKKIIILIIITIALQTQALTQTCLPNGIRFESQDDIDHFHIEYPDCTEIEGYVRISGSDITNLNGLIGLKSIGEYLWITSASDLVNLTGLDSLAFVGGNIEIISNRNLVDLTGLESLVSIEQDLFIGDYYHGSNSSLINFKGLDNVTKIGGTFHIELVQSLQNFVGLENLSFIGNNFIISYGNVLNSLTGLENLNTIGGDFMFSTMWNLQSLASLENLTSIGGSLSFWNNDALTSLNGLENLNVMDGFVRIYHNDSLRNINGIANIDQSGITDLKIEENYSLSICHIKSICSYLTNPNGTVEISSNNQGCNSATEVQDACIDLISTTNDDTYYSVFPNPAKNSLSVLSNPNLKINEIIIYDLTGQRVLCTNHYQEKINISKLDNGLYIVQLLSNNLIIRKKLVIKH